MRRVRWCEDLTDDPLRGPRLERLAEAVRCDGELVRTLMLFAEIIAPPGPPTGAGAGTVEARRNDGPATAPARNR